MLGVNNTLKKFWNVTHYDLTPFNGLRFNLRQAVTLLRGADRVEAQGGTKPGFKAYIEPLQPSPRGPAGGSCGNEGGCGQPYYGGEFIAHVLLAGADGLYLFNPPAQSTGFGGDDVLSAVLGETEALVGCAARKPIVDRRLGWTDSFLLTGMATGAAGKIIWRLSPRLPLPDGSLSPAKLVRPAGEAGGVLVGPVLVGADGQRSTTRCNVRFKRGKLLINATSVLPFGLWVAQSESDVVLECDGGTQTSWPLVSTGAAGP